MEFNGIIKIKYETFVGLKMYNFALCLKIKMRRVIILISIFITTGWASAQQSNLGKAEKAISDGFFQRAYKLTKSALVDEKTKKDPLTYYLYARSLYELSKDERFLKKNPEAIKEACSMVLKAKIRDKDKKYEGKFNDFIADLVVANNLIGVEEYKVNRYTKAIKYYTVSYNLNGDKPSYFMIGKSYQMANDTLNAKSYYKNLIKWYDEANKLNKEIDRQSHY